MPADVSSVVAYLQLSCLLELAWATLYEPLPSTLHSVSDHSAAASSVGAAATAAVSAAGGGYVPSLLCSLLPSVESFETNFATKIKDKHLMLAQSAAVAKLKSVHTRRDHKRTGAVPAVSRRRGCWLTLLGRFPCVSLFPQCKPWRIRR
jgi:hypothetical protein